MGVFLPVPGQSLYGASKAAVKLLSEGIATDIMKNSDVKSSDGNSEKASINIAIKKEPYIHKCKALLKLYK